MFESQRKTFLHFLPILILLSFLGAGCITVKNYPIAKPFIFETNVHVEGKFSVDDKKELELQLEQQLHDSVKVRSVAKAFGTDVWYLFFYELINKPTVFDSLYAGQSVLYMRALLNSLGYYRDSINYTSKIDTITNGRQLRTQLNFYVYPHTPTRLDSIAYLINADTAVVSPGQKQNLDTMQAVTLSSLSATVIKKGDLFSKYGLSAERDRLADVYRNNGYLKFSEEELLVLWDTLGIALLKPTLDPIEQAGLLQQLAQRRANPVADVEFRLRNNPDSSRITRYYVGNVTIYPDLTADTTRTFNYTEAIEKYKLKYNEPLFRKKIFPDYIFLNPGDLYRQSNYLKTQSKFNSLGAWRLVSIVQNPRPGQDTADFDIRLTPARKYNFTTNFGLSLNQGNVFIARGNLVGIELSAGIQNRNFSRGANQSSTNFRFGTELNASLKDLIQTQQISVSHTIQFPRLVPRRLPFVRNRAKENLVTTSFAMNGGFTKRKDYFDLVTFNTSWGYQFGWKNKSLSIRLPNIEYNYLTKRDSLDKLIAANASYQYIFNTGLIMSVIANFSIAGNRGNITNLASFSAEQSGLPGLFKNKIFSTTLYRFLKLDAEYRQTHKLFRNAFAWRIFAGVGFSLPASTSDSSNRYLPFFREYFAGGPNSMRAWSVRKLGPGSAVRSFDRTIAPDRFGDVRLEANAEYRIFLTNYKGISLNSALFTDVGNVWFLRNNPDFPGGEFPGSFSKLWKDLAIGLGTGLRVDFGFLKVRIDYAYKVKNPTPETLAAQNKWFYGLGIFSGQVQLGIDYPF